MIHRIRGQVKNILDNCDVDSGLSQYPDECFVKHSSSLKYIHASVWAKAYKNIYPNKQLGV